MYFLKFNEDRFFLRANKSDLAGRLDRKDHTCFFLGLMSVMLKLIEPKPQLHSYDGYISMYLHFYLINYHLSL